MAEPPRRRPSAAGNQPRKGATPTGKANARGKGKGKGQGRPQRAGTRGTRAAPRDARPEDDAPKSWGGVARRGAGEVRKENQRSRPSASEEWRAAVQSALPPDRPATTEWIRVDDDEDERVRKAATSAVARGGSRQKEPAPAAELDDDAVGRAAAEAGTRVPRLAQRLSEAARAFERERYTEARKLLRPLSERAPESAPVRELFGLTLYRLGQWKAAARELEAFHSLTGSTEQHPVLADCHRALHHYDRVDELWEELRTASPSAELVTEGRIVAAGALADRGELDRAIKLLELGMRRPKRLQEHHLRLLYALADLVERAGDVPGARQLFKRVQAADPEFADVGSRLRALR